MQAKDNTSISGEEELTQVAQRCLDSPETRLFVVGPPRSGKSTRLPVLLAALSDKKVICVQPDDRIAECHAKWIQSNGVDTIAGKKIVVGYHKDEEDMNFNFLPRPNVTYVSSRWLYRMVVGIRFNESRPFASATSMTSQRGAHESRVHSFRMIIGKKVGCVILDEVHAQSIIQELGYMAIHAATSGLVDAPMGIFKETKVICMTAYPENDTFLGYFGLSEKEIEKRVIKIDTGLAPAPKTEILIERFLADDGKESPEYHTRAVHRAQDILRSNKEARILLFMDTIYTKRNIARQNPRLPKMARVLDLETENGWNEISSCSQGPIVVLVTATFSSRIPVEGITDVICNFSQFLPSLSRKLYREIILELYLSKCELAWAKNHLDRTLKNSTIHYMFKSSVYSRLKDKYGARFLAGDLVDITLGVVRLCREHSFGNRFGNRSPTRFGMPLLTMERAFRQLTVAPSTLTQSLENRDSGEWIMASQSRSELMVKLMDRCGLDRRHAFFLGYLEEYISKTHRDGGERPLLTMIAVAMVVFDDSPIIRIKGRPGPGNVKMASEFHHLQHLFLLGGRMEATSDSWVNAVLWLDIKRHAVAAGSDITKYAQEHYKSRQFLVDQVPLEAAEARLRFLTRMTGLDERYQNSLCDGSFLDEIEKFQKASVDVREKAIYVLWESYLFAFQFTLVYVMVEKDSVKIIDICTSVEVDYDWHYPVVDLFEQAEFVASKKGSKDKKGFYATWAIRTQYGYRSLTIIPKDILCTIIEDHDTAKGSFSLQTHLTLE
ncbi:hypothetical protein F4680DRAFT_465786 [Xylaria scruposa]|nr:hypothetical protein F4680DRAFT_465786 [Xylaria scruposa]